MKFKVFIVSLIASFVSVNSAHAAVVYEQSFDPDGFGLGSHSMEDSFGDVKQMFENFTLDANSEVTSLNWYGFGGASQFAVQFYADDPSADDPNARFDAPDLGTLLYSENVTANAVPTSANPLKTQYSTDLAVPLSFLSGQQYWVSIVGLDSHFAWTISTQVTVNYAMQYDHKEFTFRPRRVEMALTLFGTSEIPPPTVPLPAAFPLFIAGISGMVAASRKRRKSGK